ncbi:hypothetical protein CJA_0564 [Cellvibrio japonicus Ueda107]|uniref:Uncharacterized protein n=1 Tax=Cellvibrio japonicus (strain Ueda107) TaxID=498211 RepID=B3PJF9_CELJU|nr:hypothetical protein CJA_0564 [Cellvibrio japonicus Ueda107]
MQHPGSSRLCMAHAFASSGSFSIRYQECKNLYFYINKQLNCFLLFLIY